MPPADEKQRHIIKLPMHLCRYAESEMLTVLDLCQMCFLSLCQEALS